MDIETIEGTITNIWLEEDDLKCTFDIRNTGKGTLNINPISEQTKDK